MERLLGGEFRGALIFVTRCFDELRHVRQAFPALGAASAAAEDLGDIARAMACSRKLTVLQRIANTHIHRISPHPLNAGEES